MSLGLCRGTRVINDGEARSDGEVVGFTGGGGSLVEEKSFLAS